MEKEKQQVKVEKEKQESKALKTSGYPTAQKSLTMDEMLWLMRNEIRA